jgi:hypothetical protein
VRFLLLLLLQQWCTPTATATTTTDMINIAPQLTVPRAHCHTAQQTRKSLTAGPQQAAMGRSGSAGNISGLANNNSSSSGSGLIISSSGSGSGSSLLQGTTGATSAATTPAGTSVVSGSGSGATLLSPSLASHLNSPSMRRSSG